MGDEIRRRVCQRGASAAFSYSDCIYSCQYADENTVARIELASTSVQTKYCIRFVLRTKSQDTWSRQQDVRASAKYAIRCTKSQRLYLIDIFLFTLSRVYGYWNLHRVVLPVFH